MHSHQGRGTAFQNDKVTQKFFPFDFLTLDIRPNILSSPVSKNIKTPPGKRCSKAPGQFWAPTKKWLTLFFIISSSLLILQCGLDVEDPTPPAPPTWIQKSLPEEWPERGIDAHESGGVYLEWGMAENDDVVAYSVYRAQYYDVYDSLGDYSRITQLESNESPATSYVDENITRDIIYYYKMKAEDLAGNQSHYSDSIYYSIQKKIGSNLMTPNGLAYELSTDRLLSWSNDYYNEVEDYCLTILTEDSELIIRTILQPTTYIDREERWVIPDSIILQSGQIYKWRIDTGGRYIDGYESSGSESSWATFLFRS
jgi:hypothetical protein